MFKILILAFCFIIACEYVAYCELYQYVDKNGNVRITDNQANIPTEHRIERQIKTESTDEAPSKLNYTQTRSSPSSSYTEHEGGMELQLIKGDCFDMGDTFGTGLFVEKPVHRVCLADYYIGRFEVRVGEFKQFVSETGYRTDAEKNSGCITWTGKDWKKVRDASWRQPGFNQSENHPAVCISWNDAQEFTRWLTKKTGRTYRLPTEAEWEYAARSGGKQFKWAGTNDISQLSKYANFCDANCVNSWKKTDQNDSYIFTAPVGTFRPNDLGLYDMSGNATEWCSDWYGATYYSESPRDNPKGPSNGDCRAHRGGSCLSDPMNFIQTFNRACSDVDFTRSDFGFRLASTPDKLSNKQAGGPAFEGKSNSR